MPGFLHRVVSRAALSGAAGVKGGQTNSPHSGSLPYSAPLNGAFRGAFGRTATLEPDAVPETSTEHETFVFSLGLGMPFFAGTPERLVTFLAQHDIDLTINLLLPPNTRREITRGERGYYCRVLVPFPNDLPDRIPIL